MYSAYSYAASKGYPYLSTRCFDSPCGLVNVFANNPKRQPNPRLLFVWYEHGHGWAYMEATDPDPSWQAIA